MEIRVKRLFILIGICIFLVGCSGQVTKDDLIGGTWVPKAYDDQQEKLKEDATCSLFNGDTTFLDDKRIHVEGEEYDLEYKLHQHGDGTDLETFRIPWGLDYYRLQALSKNEIIMYDRDYVNTCLLVRKDSEND